MPTFPGPVRHPSTSPILIINENQVSGIGVFNSLDERNQLSVFKRARGYISIMLTAGDAEAYVYIGPGSDPLTNPVTIEDWSDEAYWKKVALGGVDWQSITGKPSSFVNTINDFDGDVDIVPSDGDGNSITVSNGAGNQVLLFVPPIMVENSTVTAISANVAQIPYYDPQNKKILDSGLSVNTSNNSLTYQDITIGSGQISTSGEYLNVPSLSTSDLKMGTLVADSDIFDNTGVNDGKVLSIDWDEVNSVYNLSLKVDETGTTTEPGTQVSFVGTPQSGQVLTFANQDDGIALNSLTEVYANSSGFFANNLKIEDLGGNGTRLSAPVGTLNIQGAKFNDAFTLPQTQGAGGYVLQSDGNGNTSWFNLPSFLDGGDSGVFSINGATEAVFINVSNGLDLDVPDGESNINISLTATTDNIPESDSPTNKYYTDARFSNSLTSALPNYADIANISAIGSGTIISDVERNKLEGIDEGAQVNVTPNWNAESGAPGFIANKPDIPEYTDDIEEATGATNRWNRRGDWNADENSLSFILNKPTKLTDFDNDLEFSVTSIIDFPQSLVNTVNGVSGAVQIVGGSNVDVANIEGEISISFDPGPTGDGNPYYLSDLADVNSYDVVPPIEGAILMANGVGQWTVQPTGLPITLDVSDLDYLSNVNPDFLPENSDSQLILVQEENVYKKLPYNQIWYDLFIQIQNEYEAAGYDVDTFLGSAAGIPGDLDDTGTIGTSDLLIFLANFGGLAGSFVEFGALTTNSEYTVSFEQTMALADEGFDALGSAVPLVIPSINGWEISDTAAPSDTSILIESTADGLGVNRITFDNVNFPVLQTNDIKLYININIDISVQAAVDLKIFAKITRVAPSDGQFIDIVSYHQIYNASQTAGGGVISIEEIILTCQGIPSYNGFSYDDVLSFNDGVFFLPSAYTIQGEGETVIAGPADKFHVQFIPAYENISEDDAGATITYNGIVGEIEIKP